MEEDSVQSKRIPDDSEELPDAKRLRVDFPMDVESVNCDSTAPPDPVISVVKNFNEETAVPQPLSQLSPDPEDQSQPDLGYPMEVAHDELGLPTPTHLPSSSESVGEAFSECFDQMDVCAQGFDFGLLDEEFVGPPNFLSGPSPFHDDSCGEWSL